MKQIYLTDAEVGAVVFIDKKRCTIVRQYTGFSWLKNEVGERTGGKIPVLRTKLSYISAYQDEYDAAEGFYSHSTPIICEKIIDSKGVYVMAE